MYFSIILTLKLTQFKTKDSCFRLGTLFAMNQRKPSSLSNLNQLNPAGLSLVEGTWVHSTFNWPSNTRCCTVPNRGRVGIPAPAGGTHFGIDLNSRFTFPKRRYIIEESSSQNTVLNAAHIYFHVSGTYFKQTDKIIY